MAGPRAVFVRTPFVHLDTSDILQQPVTVLLGVSEAARDALHKLSIETVFDLGASSVFSTARAVTAAAAVGSASARLGVVPSDWLNPDATFDSLEDIGQLGIEHLRGIAPADAADLKAALDVESIQELANWPPHARARALVRETAGGTSDPEESQAEELRPRMGEYPTERVYYSTLVMLQMQPDDEELDALNSPVSLMPAVERKSGFNKPAVGALLTYSQSWYSQGITLGQLLHCLALAPGEATRIALVDWSRRQTAMTEEGITETEQLDQAAAHSRALSEVQNAVANEMQSGGSAATTRATSESESEAWSDSSGVVQSILGSSSGGSGGWQSATTEATSQSSSWTIGSRSVLAELSQTVNDRTEQHASSVRNRRASAVREVSQSEHEQISTRIVANYNHMHALTVQYYEVVQIYRTIAKLHRATRCLFVPLELLDFSGEDAMSVVEHFRGALLAGAITRRAASLLADDTTTVAVEPVTPTKLIGRRPELLGVRVARLARAIDSSGSSNSPAEPEADAPEPARSLPFRTWNPAEVAKVSKLLSRPVVRPDSDNLFLPDDTELVGISFAGANVTAVRMDSEAGSETRTVTTESNYVEFAAPVRLLEIDALHVAKADQAAATGTVTLHCAYMGRRFSAPSIPMQLPAGTGLSKAVSFTSDQADRRKELLAHLQANRAHYSQAIFRRLDAATITMLLSRYTWNGRPLAEQVEPRPYTVAGNYLVLPAPVEDDEPSGVAGASGETLTWGRLLAERRLSRGDVDQRLIPIPTGGVFAEAVLGRSNSAEKLDITRFWNWQDSPIPLAPPEIAPVAAGSRATAEGLQPGQLGQPLLNIVNPQPLPDPSGMAAVLGALASGNMFRDMSGLAGTQTMTERAVSETLHAATDAGRLASDNMRVQAEKAVSMGQIAADVAKTAIGGHYALAQAKAGASSPKGAGSGGSVQGISGDGARINHGREMDERKVPGTGGTSSSASLGDGSAGGGSGASGGGGNGSGIPMDAQPASSFSREAAYADTGAFGYSPEGFHNTRPPVVTEIPPVVVAAFGGGGPASFFLQRLKHVTTVLGFFVSKPVKVFLNLHKTHFDVLGKVLDAVRRGRQIQNVITAAEANLMKFRDEAASILNHAQSIPQDPLEGIPNWSLQDLNALSDPAVVRARQDYLNRYREAVTTALQVAQNLVQVGERIDSESRPLLQQLHTEVQNLPSNNNAEAVVKQAIYQDVQFLELYFSKYVAPSVRNAESAVSYLTTAKANIEAILQ